MFSAVWLAVNLITGIVGLGPTGILQPIAWQDHLGGYLAGLLLAGAVRRIFRSGAPSARPRCLKPARAAINKRVRVVRAIRAG